MASYANLSADQGADFRVKVDLENSNGDSLDLTLYELYGQARKTYKSAYSVDFDISVSGNPVGGSIFIELPSEKTIAMKAGRYVYDVYALHTVTNEATKIVEGIIEIVPSVTKNIEY